MIRIQAAEVLVAMLRADMPTAEVSIVMNGDRIAVSACWLEEKHIKHIGVVVPHDPTPDRLAELRDEVRTEIARSGNL